MQGNGIQSFKFKREHVQTVSVVRYTRADELNRRIMSTTAVIVFTLTLGVSRILACSWAIGYFYQVTNLRGAVVGSDFPVLHSFRWYRQSVMRPNTKLMLYEYCWPCDALNHTPVKTVITDAHGKFDFGSVKPGHYYLKIGDEPLLPSALFQVEVRGTQNPKQSEIIDISPVYPDCTGGHEFIVRAN
jgi:hypothetical protein